MTIIDLNKEIDEAPDTWFLGLPDINRLFLKRWSSTKHIASASMSNETRLIIKNNPYYKDHFHKVYPNLHNNSGDRGVDGWVIKSPVSNKFYLYLLESNKYFELSSLEEVSKISIKSLIREYRWSGGRSREHDERVLIEENNEKIFYELAKSALKNKIKLAKKNNPELLDGIVDVAATKSQLTIMTKFNKLENQVGLFKHKLQNNDNSDLYKQDLEDLFSAFAVFKNSLTKVEIAMLKSRPKEKKSKK